MAQWLTVMVGALLVMGGACTEKILHAPLRESLTPSRSRIGESFSQFRTRLQASRAIPRLPLFYDRTDPPKHHKRAYESIFPDLATIYEVEEDRLALYRPPLEEGEPALVPDDVALISAVAPLFDDHVSDPGEILLRYARTTVPELFDPKLGIESKPAFLRFLREIFIKGSGSFPLVWRMAIKGKPGWRGLIRELYDQTAFNPIYYASHGADHGLRVMDGCIDGLVALKPHLKVDMNREGMMLACLCHDIGYPDITPDESDPSAIAPPKWLHSIAGMALLSKAKFPRFHFHTYASDYPGIPTRQREMLDKSIGNHVLEAVGLHNFGDTIDPVDVAALQFSDTNRYPFIAGENMDKMQMSVIPAALNDNPYAFFTRLGDTLDVSAVRLSDFQNNPRTMRILWALWALGTVGGFQLTKLPETVVGLDTPSWLSAAFKYADHMDSVFDSGMTEPQKGDIDLNFQNEIAKRIPHIMHNQFAHWYGNYAINVVSMQAPKKGEDHIPDELFRISVMLGTVPVPDLAWQNHIKWSIFQVIRASSGLDQLYINTDDPESIVGRVRITVVSEPDADLISVRTQADAVAFLDNYVQNKPLNELALDSIPEDDFVRCIETVNLLEKLAGETLVSRIDPSELKERKVNMN